MHLIFHIILCYFLLKFCINTFHSKYYNLQDTLFLIIIKVIIAYNSHNLHSLESIW